MTVVCLLTSCDNWKCLQILPKVFSVAEHLHLRITGFHYQKYLHLLNKSVRNFSKHPCFAKEKAEVQKSKAPCLKPRKDQGLELESKVMQVSQSSTSYSLRYNHARDKMIHSTSISSLCRFCCFLGFLDFTWMELGQYKSWFPTGHITIILERHQLLIWSLVLVALTFEVLQEFIRLLSRATVEFFQ